MYVVGTYRVPLSTKYAFRLKIPRVGTSTHGNVMNLFSIILTSKQQGNKVGLLDASYCKHGLVSFLMDEILDKTA